MFQIDELMKNFRRLRRLLDVAVNIMQREGTKVWAVLGDGGNVDFTHPIQLDFFQTLGAEFLQDGKKTFFESDGVQVFQRKGSQVFQIEKGSQLFVKDSINVKDLHVHDERAE